MWKKGQFKQVDDVPLVSFKVMMKYNKYLKDNGDNSYTPSLSIYLCHFSFIEGTAEIL
jgi:hypothetical protein